MSGGSTGERPFTDVITSIRYWLIHGITIPVVFFTGFIFVVSGAPYEIFGTPRPDEYFVTGREGVPILTARYNVQEELEFLAEGL